MDGENPTENNIDGEEQNPELEGEGEGEGEEGNEEQIGDEDMNVDN